MAMKNDWVESVSQKLGIPESVLPNIPRVTVTSGSALVENHRGIAELGTDLIEIKGGKAALRIRGEGLALKAMNRTELVITGRLFSVELD